MSWAFHHTILLSLIYLLPLLRAQAIPPSYAPKVGICPSGPLIRSSGSVQAGTQALGAEEAAYIKGRRARILPSAYRQYLANVEAYQKKQRSQLPSYVRRILLGSPEQLPRVSGSLSGGGLRASFVGAGFLNAFDGRNTTAVTSGTGGLLQAFDYLSGLSGGACLAMSLAQGNFPTIYAAVLGRERNSAPSNKTTNANGDTEGWLADMNFVAPAGLLQAYRDVEWWTTVATQVAQKANNGFEVTLGDIYARVLSYHFVNGTTRANFFDPRSAHGLEETLSSLANVPTIKDYSQPFPIITTVPQSKGQGNIQIQQGEAIPITNNQYEFNIYEAGSWDPNLASFVKTSILGTKFQSGRPTNSEKCVTKFDNLGFLISASSNVFRKYDEFATFFNSKAYRPILPAFKTVLSVIPNPFYGLGTPEYLDRESSSLELMDGSFGGENIPFAPLLVPARKVDVIVAFDASDNQNGWPDGTSLRYTSARSKLMPPKSYPFPRIPTQVSGINSSRPTFFGCEESEPPLVIYVPNAPASNLAVGTNLPTITLEVARSKAVQLIDGGTNLASRGILNDPHWPGCLACAVVDRSRRRNREKRTGICATCFQKYCSP
ncbi:hypothetical protein O181_018797 [Austropuccinia psidii MF-1]|uniref:Lysophospholipase n=1 Tax=Austropuccinia psidii MF-1 TaxID=1389203 RepID=A0A9Q3GTU4_9BASI|nr:hypothetical protein [Austropuccinia psidii MF-1]